MKINELKVNSYGKLKDKDIALEDGINVIYGENEKGKSTLLNFMVNIFYGTSRNKKGRDVSDYERYKPWDTEEFSGKLVYTLDNGEKYEVFREFSKKSPKIYNSEMEDVSKEYSVDKTSGSQFFVEQTKVDESTFVSSVVSYQNEVELNGQTQNVLLQKIANSSSTGDDNISYKKAMDKLNKKQLDEIGTNRSQGKPINIVINEMENLNSRNEYLKQYENYKYEIEDKRNIIDEEIDKLNIKYKVLKEYNGIVENEKIERQKLKFSEEKIDELEQKIEKLNANIDNLKSDKKEVSDISIKKVNSLPFAIGGIAFLIVAVVLFIIMQNVVISAIPVVMAGIVFALYFSKAKKVKVRNYEMKRAKIKVESENEEINRREYEIKAQLNLLEKSRADQIDEFERIKNEVIKSIEGSKERLRANYFGKIDNYELNKIFESKDLPSELSRAQDLINEKKLELHRLELDKENIMPKLDELAENEEKYENYEEVYEDLKKKNEAINVAKEILESAYQKMKSSVTPKFTQDLSKNVSMITGGKYNRVIIDEDEGIFVELPNGEFKNANRLSIGTIQQLYLAFRLSVIESLSDQTLPIILDETFAFYDDKRLEETLVNLQEYYSKNHQIILFTCTDREERILNKLQYKYNRVSL